MRTIFLIITCCFFSTFLVAAEKGVEVSLSGEELLKTEPRRIVTTAFLITNKNSQPREFTSEVNLPEGWTLVTRDFSFALDANESEIRLVTFFIPQAALARKHQITYWVKEKESPFKGFSTAYVTVLPVNKLEVKLLESPEYVVAGEDYQATFVVINESNIENTVEIKIDSGEDLPFMVESEKLKLAPGESKTITVVVKTDKKTRKILNHCLRLTARVFKNKEIKDQAASLVEIIPRITVEVKKQFNRIPSVITLSPKNEDGKSGLQTEISGSGTLDEEGKRHIRFFLRGPDIQDKSSLSHPDIYHATLWAKDYELHLGEREESFFRYWKENYELHLGAHHYGLSPLTENNRHSWGIKGRVNLDNFSLGAYYAEPRWIESGEKQTAGHLDYLIRNKYKIGLNYLKESKPANNEMASLHGQFKPTENTDIELEYALGKKDKEADNAWLLSVHGHREWISYYLRLIHAGPDYPGYYSDMDFVSAHLAAPLGKRLKLNGGVEQEKKNLDLEPTLSAPLSKSYRLGLDYQFKTGLPGRLGPGFSLGWEDYRCADLLPNPKFDYQKETFRFSARQRFKKASLYASAESGKVRDKLNNHISLMERYALSTYFRPTRSQSYTGYLRHGNNTNSTGEKSHWITTGLDIYFQITDRTSLNLNYQKDDYQESSDGDQDFFEIRLRHRLANNHKISVHGHYTSSGNSEQKDRSALMVEYSLPFRLPVSRKQSDGQVGIVKGHVYDEKTKEAISGVILRINGATAVTGKNGDFVFPCLRSDTYYLDVARIGLNRITVRPTPIKVSVESGRETLLEIGITQRAALFGQVMVYDFENKHNNNGKANYYIGGNTNGSLNHDETRLAKTSGLANILVELTNGPEIKRRLTNGEGRFEFEELRPGKWTLKIYDHNLPQYHYLEKDTFEFELKPGGEEEVLVKVLPRKRRIHIIEEGGTLLEEEKEKE